MDLERRDGAGGELGLQAALATLCVVLTVLGWIALVGVPLGG